MQIKDIFGGGRELWSLTYFTTQLAPMLGLAYGVAKEMWESNGYGYCYTPTGLVLPDSERNRQKLVRAFGRIIIAEADTQRLMVWHNGDNRHKRRKVAKLAHAERRTERVERRAILEARRREKSFNELAEKRHPKHQGRGKSHSDIGRFVPSRKAPDCNRMMGAPFLDTFEIYHW